MRWSTSSSTTRVLKGDKDQNAQPCNSMLDGRRTRCFCGNTLEDIIDEGVQDGHRLVRDTSVRVDLLED